MHQKYIISALAGVVLIGGIAYLNFGGDMNSEEGFYNPQPQINTQTHSPIPKPPHTGIIVETNTVNRIETSANSGTNWGVSPFGSGKLVEESSMGLFNNPNTEWRTRQVTLADGRTLTYEFGKGNPVEVSLTLEDMLNMQQQCGTESDPTSSGFLCKEMDGYVTAEVEKHIELALNDENWKYLLAMCRENFSPFENNRISYLKSFPNNDGIINYSIVSSTNFLDINQWIGIDLVTHRKTLDVARLLALESWIKIAMQAQWEVTDWPVGSDGKKVAFANPSCVDTYGMEILRNLIIAKVLYLAPHTP